MPRSRRFLRSALLVALPRGILAVSIAAFATYCLVTAYGDLIPVEQIGANIQTTSRQVVVESVSPAGPAARAGLQSGDRVHDVDGRPMRNPLDWASVFARLETNQPIPLRFERDGTLHESTIVFGPRPGGPWGTPESTVVVLTRVIQLVTLGFAIALGVRARDGAAALGAWLLATISIYSVGMPPRMAAVWRQMPWPLELLWYVPSISKVLIGFILFLFFRALARRPMSRPALTLASLPFLACAAWDLAFLRALLYRPDHLPALTGYLPYVIAVNFAYIGAAVAMLGFHYRSQSDPSVRRRLRWIVASSMVGCAAGAPTVAGLWLGVNDDPTLMYHSPLRVQLAYTAFLVMPASFWWAIARGELFDIGFVVRRGLQYVFARHALLVITPAVLALLILQALAQADRPLQTILADNAALYTGTAIGLLLFSRFRQTWLDALDRRLFRERYDACQLLRELAAEVRTTRDLQTAAGCAIRQIDRALHPYALAIYSEPAPGEHVLVATSTTTPAWLDAARPFDGAAAADHPVDRAADRPVAGVLQPRLVVTAALPDCPRVTMVFAGRRSGEPYSAEDRNLVHAVAESLADLAGAQAEAVANDGGWGGGWHRRLWNMADAVVRGVPLDWKQEPADALTQEHRQTLLELQALEALMHVHGTADDDDQEQVPPGAGQRWGRFHLRAPVGAGRFGSVYRAWDPVLERDVALKLLRGSRRDRDAYLREARNLARVRHPNVVHVYGAGVVSDIPAFWMELIDGETLAGIVAAGTVMTPHDVAAIGTTLCAALSAVHRAGLVHQDVKAENVMRDGDGRLVLMDLGAGLDGEKRPYSGTLRYMAPELFDNGAATPRSDLYSLGVLLFFLMAGCFPVDGRSRAEIASAHRSGRQRALRSLRPDMPGALDEAIACCLATAPDDRFATAADLGRALKEAS